MNTQQIEWLAANGIDTATQAASHGFVGGRVFTKGEFGLCSYNGRVWELEARDDSEDGEGSLHVGSFGTLKKGLAALRAAA